MDLQKNDLQNQTKCTIKKVFLSEFTIENAKNPEELKKILGVKREEIEKIKEEKKGKIQSNSKRSLYFTGGIKRYYSKE